MVAEEAAEIGHVIMPRVAEIMIFRRVDAIFLMHERTRIPPQIFADARIVAQVCVERRVVLNELPVVGERGISANLFGDLPVVVEEAVEVSQLPAILVAVGLAAIRSARIDAGSRTLGAVSASAGIAAEAIFLLHEGDGILMQGLVHGRVLAAVGRPSAPDGSRENRRIVRECGVRAKLFGHLAVRIEESRELRELAALGVFLHEGDRILADHPSFSPG